MIMIDIIMIIIVPSPSVQGCRSRWWVMNRWGCAAFWLDSLNKVPTAFSASVSVSSAQSFPRWSLCPGPLYAEKLSAYLWQQRVKSHVGPGQWSSWRMGRNDPLRKGVRLIHAGESPKRLPPRRSWRRPGFFFTRVCLCVRENRTFPIIIIIVISFKSPSQRHFHRPLMTERQKYFHIWPDPTAQTSQAENRQ